MNDAVFANYARYYDLLYRDKDYASEALYIHGLIQSHFPGAKTVLNLGCGTGRHDLELARLNYQVTGVDQSEQMLRLAASRIATSGIKAPVPCFVGGDIRNFRLGKWFDAVISLFHVMSYQVGNQDLLDACATAAMHLEAGGLFVFDCWYGPAVLTDPPVVRVKRLEDEALSVLRIAEPVLHYNLNAADINYQVLITDKETSAVTTVKECHRMRYLFLPEIDQALRITGFEPIASHGWMTTDAPGAGSWYLVSISRKLS